MKTAIITAAGMSTRFCANLKEPCLKCIYTANGKEQTLLYNLLEKCDECDRVIVVGGYQFESLSRFIQSCPPKFRKKVQLVKNPHFETYGTGYSFYIGLSAIEEPSDEIILIEGDLFVDSESMEKIQKVNKDAISICSEPIFSNRSVAVYTDVSEHLHFLYQTDHGAFQIEEAFTSIFNSAQIWKFFNVKRLYSILRRFSKSQIRGTNLEMVQAYFGELEREQYEIIPIKTWINCNTTEDYEKITELIKERQI